jgi:MoxR-like ATPase
LGLYKAPGVAETIDWARALAALGSEELDQRAVLRTLGSIAKYREDVERVAGSDLAGLIEEAARHG